MDGMIKPFILMQGMLAHDGVAPEDPRVQRLRSGTEQIVPFNASKKVKKKLKARRDGTGTSSKPVKNKSGVSFQWT